MVVIIKDSRRIIYLCLAAKDVWLRFLY